MTLEAWYGELDRQLANSSLPFVETWSQKYAQPWAIPFFGQIEVARVLTVGVNPCFSEFDKPRWDGIASAGQAVERLVKYFQGAVFPHEWFTTWEKALNEVGASYRGTPRILAAHVDVWSRATYSLSEFPEESLLECMGAEIHHFVSTLELARNATIILMAGSITGDFYLNQFIKAYLPEDVGRLDGSFNPRGQPGSGKTAVHTLHIGKRKWPVIFCGTSPSDRKDSAILIQRMQEYAPVIKRLGNL